MNQMENKNISFNFGTNVVRTNVDSAGGIWFCARDVAEAIEHTDAEVMLRIVGESETVKFLVPNSRGELRGTRFIAESGLYRILFRSSLPKCNPFQDWLATTVLPSIRKTGGYTASQPGNKLPTQLETSRMLVTDANTDPRFLPVGFKGKTYITSTLLHKQKREAGMLKYAELTHFNRMIRNLDTYEQLCTGLYVVEIIRDPEMSSLLKSNSYNPLLLLDPVAQKAIEHFLDDEQSKESSLQTNQSSAIQGISGIDLTTLDATDPATLFALQFLKEKTEHAKTKRIAAEEKGKLLQENANLAPKAEFADKLMNCEGLISMSALAILLQKNGAVTGQKRLFKWMRDNGYLTKDNNPTQSALNLKVLQSIEGLAQMGSTLVPVFTTKVTAKGQEYFLRKFEFSPNPLPLPMHPAPSSPRN